MPSFGIDWELRGHCATMVAWPCIGHGSAIVLARTRIPFSGRCVATGEWPLIGVWAMGDKAF
eukprot:2868305-Lingulodinium_polyedra.AAC.1